MELVKVTDQLLFPEGPLPLPDGSCLVVEVQRGTVSRVTDDGAISVVGEMGGGPNGMAMGPDGLVYVCNNGGLDFYYEGDYLCAQLNRHAGYVGGSIQTLDIGTGEVRTLFTHCGDRPLNGPNDIVFDRTGGFWFTDIGRTYDGCRDIGIVYYARADGSDIQVMREEIPTPNGIGLSPDETVVYVADSMTGRLWALDIAAPGALAPPPNKFAPGRIICTLPGFQALDSLAVEASGKVCVATILNGGITIFDPSGSYEHVPVPDPITTNIAFGGEDMRDAWITAGGTRSLYKCRWPRPGLRLNNM